MMFGINELGWRSLELFRDYYVELIEEVKKLQPDAKIYILSIFPVTQKTSEVDKTFNNDNVTAEPIPKASDIPTPCLASTRSAYSSVSNIIIRHTSPWLQLVME